MNKKNILFTLLITLFLFVPLNIKASFAAEIKGTSVRIRKEHNANSDNSIIATVNAGTSITVVDKTLYTGSGCSNKWYKIIYKDISGKEKEISLDFSLKEIVAEFRELWNSKYSLSFDEFYENYKERYKIIKHQRDIAKQEEITSLENKLSDLRNATDICPTCGQPINSPEHIAKRDEEIKTLSSTLETKRAEFEQKSALKKVYDDALAFNQKTKDECTNLEKQIASLTSEKEKALLENFANQKSTESAISVLSEKYATQRIHVQEMISSIEKNISQLEESEVKLNASIEELKSKVVNVDYSSEIANLENEVHSYEGKLQLYADYESQITFYKDTLAKVEEQKKEDAKLLDKTKLSLQEEAAAVKDREVEAKLLKTDFPVYVISRVVKDLEHRMNEFLKKTYGGRYTIKMKDKGNALHIVYGPKDQDVALSSGYERSLFNLAFKISISKAIGNKKCNFKGRNTPPFCYAENLACLVDKADNFAASPRNAKLFYQVLAQTVGQYFDQIILVSHKDEVKEMLENEYKAEVLTFVSGVAQ